MRATLSRIALNLAYRPWADRQNPSLCGYKLRPGLDFLYRFGLSRYAIFSGGLHLPVGSEVVVKHSRSSNYFEAIQEWEVVQDTGKVAVRYNPQGEKDAFGNYPHYIFTIRNQNTRVELLLGRNDVESHGLLTRNEVKAVIKEKNQEVKSYRSSLILIRKYSRFCELSGQEQSLLDREKFGDAQYPLIEALFSKVEGELKSRGYDFEKERKYEELFGAYEELERAGFKGFYFSDTEIKNLDDLCLKWREAEELLKREEVEALDKLYKKVFDLQYALRSSSGLWAHGKVEDTYRFENCLQAAAAWQANLYVANLYAERIRNGEIREAIDLGAGSSPLYQILAEIGALPHGRMIDVEYDEAAYNKAKNPRKIRASITDLGTILERGEAGLEVRSSSFDLATSVFVFTHLKREQRKAAIAEGLRVLKTGGEMLIAMPESFGFGKKIIKGIIELGGEIIGVDRPEPNRLGEEEREICREAFGSGVLRIVEWLVSKRFNVLRVKKARDVSREEIDKVGSKLFVFVRSRRKGKGSRKAEENGLRQDYLIALAYAAGELHPNKISVTPTELIPAEAIEEQYVGFGGKYIDLRCLKPILSKRDVNRLDQIEADCNQTRAIDKADIEWMVELHTKALSGKINASRFRDLFPEVEQWRGSEDFSGLMVANTRVSEIFDYPEEQRGKKITVRSALRLARTSYANAVDFKVRRLILELTKEELMGNALNVHQLAELIGCSTAPIWTSFHREGDDRLTQYIIYKDKGSTTNIVLFDEAQVREDLEKIKESFGKGGERLPLQPGEITAAELADLIGCHHDTIMQVIRNQSDNRLAPYLLGHIRVVSGKDINVFDREKVVKEIERLKESFGKGGERLPPQPGEIIINELGDLIGCHGATIRYSLEREDDTRLDPYLLGHTRVSARRNMDVFDKAKVMADIERLKESFGKGGERLSPQPGEITISEMADLVGCSGVAIANALKREGDTRLDSYLLGHTRVWARKDIVVFDRMKVMGNLEALKEAFGKGGSRLPPQPGEITTRELAELIGCAYNTIGDVLRRNHDNRLDPYLLDYRRIVRGQESCVFDKARVLKDLEKLKKNIGQGDQSWKCNIKQFAALIGCPYNTIYSAIRRGDKRLMPYLLDHPRVIRGHSAKVFDKGKVMRDLELIKRAFKKV